MREGKIQNEGELFKVIETHGKKFELYYGYYEDCDRSNPFVDPVPIYPDFVVNPVYTSDGQPFVTDMQDACKYYEGKRIEDGCYSCEHYVPCEDFIGICSHSENMKEKDR